MFQNQNYIKIYIEKFCSYPCFLLSPQKDSCEENLFINIHWVFLSYPVALTSFAKEDLFQVKLRCEYPY